MAEEALPSFEEEEEEDFLEPELLDLPEGMPTSLADATPEQIAALAAPPAEAPEVEAPAEEAMAEEALPSFEEEEEEDFLEPELLDLPEGMPTSLADATPEQIAALAAPPIEAPEVEAPAVEAVPEEALPSWDEEEGEEEDFLEPELLDLPEGMPMSLADATPEQIAALAAYHPRLDGPAAGESVEDTLLNVSEPVVLPSQVREPAGPPAETAFQDLDLTPPESVSVIEGLIPTPVSDMEVLSMGGYPSGAPRETPEPARSSLEARQRMAARLERLRDAARKRREKVEAGTSPAENV
jgi:hypothetical protein